MEYPKLPTYFILQSSKYFPEHFCFQTLLIYATLHTHIKQTAKLLHACVSVC
jgi:hypothetical protein